MSKFPVYKEAPDGTIVQFISKTKGYVVRSGLTEETVGSLLKELINFDNPSIWRGLSSTEIARITEQESITNSKEKYKEMDEFPCYREPLNAPGVIVKFTDKHVGTVVKGASIYSKGETRSNWLHYDDPFAWKKIDMPVSTSEDYTALSLFQPKTLTSGSTLTKVPNGYIMTSHSGHQIFIADKLKESL